MLVIVCFLLFVARMERSEIRDCCPAFRCAPCGLPRLLHPLDRQRQALADAHAQGRNRTPAALLLELMGRCQSETRTRHAERMAERDRATVRIDVRGIVLEAELAQAG